MPIALLFLLALAPRGPASGERMGNASIVTAHLPAAMRARHPMAGTVREGEHFGYRIAFPKGPCTLELGFAELFHEERGARSFDVVVNEEKRIEGLDLVEAAGPAPSVHVVTLEARARRRGVAIWLHADKGRATLAWLRVSNGVHEVVVDCGGFGEPLSKAERAPLGEALFARFGSRFLLTLQPQWKRAAVQPRGLFTRPPEPLLLGVEVEGERFALPFQDGLAPLAPEVNERRSPGGATYRFRAAGERIEIDVDAPIDPRDRAFSALPAVWVRFRRTGATDDERSVRAFFSLPERAEGAREAPLGRGGRALVSETEEGDAVALAARGPWAFDPGSFEASVELPPDGERVLVLAGWAPGLRLTVFGEEHVPEPLARFEDVEDMLRAALDEQGRASRAREKLDDLVSGVPETYRRLLSFALPSLLANTWWTRGPDGSTFYSCQEGRCRFHSTIDVEMNQAAFYAWFGPDLLRGLLEAWPRTLRPGGFLGHDLGLASVGEPAYDHEMPIEENTNYVLLLEEYLRMSGDSAFCAAKAPLVERLLDFVLSCDADRDGFFERHCANTFDDARPIQQFARGQSYLSFKAAAALLAGARILREADRELEAQRLEREALRIGRALAGRAWRGDHFAVSVDPNAAGLTDPWGRLNGGRPFPEGTVFEGADDPSSLTLVGLLPLLRGGPFTQVSEDLLRKDLLTSLRACERRFGWSHTAGEDAVWVSQNLARDAVAAYLGLDPTRHAERYLDLQRSRARERDLPLWSGWCDAPTNPHLSYYPRGVAVLAAIDALGGVRLDRARGTLTMRPVRADLRLPLAALADPESGETPFVLVERDDEGRPHVGVEGRRLLDGLSGGIDLGLLGGDFVPWSAVKEAKERKRP